MSVVAVVVAGLLTAGCVGSLLYTKVEIVIAGISFVRFFLFVDILGLCRFFTQYQSGKSHGCIGVCVFFGITYTWCGFFTQQMR